MDGAAPDTRLNAQRKAYTAARSDAGIDVVRSSDFAVIAAENSALERLAVELAEQIGTRLALLARTTPELQATAPAQ